MTALAGWENVYVIVGSSAGAFDRMQFRGYHAHRRDPNRQRCGTRQQRVCHARHRSFRSCAAAISGYQRAVARGAEVKICLVRGTSELQAESECQSPELIEGELEVTIDGVAEIARAGLVAIVPGNARHSVRALTDGQAIIVDYPRRRHPTPARPRTR